MAVDFVAIFQFGNQPLPTKQYWLIASFISTGVYVYTARRMRTEFFGYITAFGMASSVLALTAILDRSFNPVWWVATVGLSSVGMVWISARLQRDKEKWGDIAPAFKRLPQLLTPAAIFVVLFVPGDVSLGQFVVFGFATLSYFLLTVYFPRPMYVYAGVWSSIGGWFFLLATFNIPLEWYASVWAILSPIYVLGNRFFEKRLVDQDKPYRGFQAAFHSGGYALLSAAVVAGLFTLPSDIWAGVIALTIVCGMLDWWSQLLKQPILAFLASSLFFIPYSIAISRWLQNAGVSQWEMWLVVAWGGLALIYTAIGVVLKRKKAYALLVYYVAQVLTLIALLGVIAVHVLTEIDELGPTLTGLGSIILVYLLSAVILHSGKHGAFEDLLVWLPKRLRPAAFI
ncbi:MAG: hypothetical protein FVQ83_00180 [Chloroflexi bacterium]|nr:hypothetical protein [Chloroflexota bacterium]